MTKTSVSAQYAGVSQPERPPGQGLDFFDEVYQREFEYVCRNLGRLGVPAADIQDAMHEVFLVLYRRWNEIDPTRPIRPWLFGVARRIAAAVRAKRREILVEIDVPSIADPLAAQRDLLWRALDTLDEDRRVVVILHDLEGHTGAEIAALLDVPANTVHSRLRTARAELVSAVRRLEAR